MHIAILDAPTRGPVDGRLGAAAGAGRNPPAFAKNDAGLVVLVDDAPWRCE
jgi:hypothetical protein